MTNRYFKLYTESPFCGTDNTELFITDGADFDVDYDEIAQDLFDSYGYLIHGWGEEDPTEEEIDDFILNCTVDLKEISEKEFYELLDDGFSYRRVD